MNTYEYPQPLPNRKPGSRAARIQKAILEEISNLDGTPTTIRFLFYRLVATEVIPKSYAGTRTPSQDVSEVATELRLAGAIPLGSIVDRSRGTLNYTGYSSVRRGVIESLETYRLDPWNGVRPQLWVESDSLAGVLEPIARQYRIPITALRGQASISLANELASGINNESIILYVGDLDLSGGHIESSIMERVAAFAGCDFVNLRLAVTQRQVEAFNLTEIQKYDKRTRKHSSAVEAEALGQGTLEHTVRDAMSALLSRSGWSLEELESQETDEQVLVRTVLEDAS